MTQWTEQQQSAIEVRGRSIIVAAAAGSGKTAVLVERLLRILSDTENRVPAESIVVVTFTNDAASQMKQRLYNAFSKKIAGLPPDDEETYLWLLRQQSALGGAHISTINSFCFQLIRENADLCGVSAQFRVCEPSEERIYADRALKKVITKYSREHREEMQRLCDLLCTQNDAELEPVILSIAGFLKSTAFPDLWLQKAYATAGNREAFLKEIFTSLREKLSHVLGLIRLARPYAEAVMGANSAFTALLDTDECDITLHYNMLVPEHYEKFAESPKLHYAQFPTFPRTSKGVDADAKAVFKLLRDDYKAVYTSAMKHTITLLQYLQEDLAVEEWLVPQLLDLTRGYLDALFAEKQSRNVLSFDDGERLALSLLGNVQEDGTVVPTPLAGSLSSQYRIIMVDEYQDSNNKQDCLFKLLSAGGYYDAEKGRMCYGTNAFLVGDVKQSIYSFRLANVRNFMEAMDDSRPLDACGGDETACIYLNRNFRSSEGVIDFVNALFGCLMSDLCGEVEYNENEQLNFGAAGYKGKECPTTLLFPDRIEEIPEELDPQAVCTADTIARMLAEHTPVYDREGNARPCTPADFCILMRSVKSEGVKFIEALAERGIPAACSDNEDAAFLDQPEIRLITNILRVVDNPLADIPLASLLLSPIYAFTSEDLLALRLYARHSRLYLQMKSCADEAAPDAEIAVLSQKCRQVLDQLERLRSEAALLSLDECIELIFEETDLLSLQSLYDNAQERRLQLRSYLQFAKSYRMHGDLEGKGTLSGWLHHLDNLKALGSDLEGGELPQNAADCVSIKTIHKSKGLEFPFVFLVHLDKAFSNRPSHALVIPDDSGRVGVKFLNKEQYQRASTVSLQHILQTVYQKQKSEEMRLLYVAMTRAQQQMFLLIGGSRKKRKSNPLKYAALLQACPQRIRDIASSASCMEDWIYLFLLAGSESEYLYSIIEEGENCRSSIASYVLWHPEPAPIEALPEPAQLQSQPDAAIVRAMEAQLEFSYTSDQTQLIAKQSVTSLAHPEEPAMLHLREPAFISEGREGSAKLRGAARGTAVHKMLQYMNFADAAANPEAELARLSEEGYLTPSEAQTLNAEHLCAFFSSSLYAAIAASPEVYKEKQIFVRIGDLDLPENSLLHQQYAASEGILIGTMDLLFRDSDGWVIVDYKTDHGKTAQQLLDTYSLQLGLYQKAAEKILGAPVHSAYLYSFTLDRALPIALSEIDYTSGMLPESL